MRTATKALIGVGGAIVVIGAIGALASPSSHTTSGGGQGGGASYSTPTSNPNPPSTATPAPTATPQPTATPTPTQVVFSVTGNPGEGVDITYGTDTTNLAGGPNLPWSATLPLDNSGNVMYYALDAQLQGPDGNITCSISINGKVISSGQAAGDYNICSAQIGQNFNGQWGPE